MDELADILQWKLLQPPACAGERLQSERDLAKLLGCERQKLRRSMDMLVKKGVLVRRHGSGTYIRKVIDLPNIRPKWLDSCEVTTESLLAKPRRGASRKPREDQVQLALGVWGSLHSTTDTNRLILKGIRHRIEQLGHRLDIQSMLVREQHEETEVVPSVGVEELIRRLEAHPADGYLVTADMASVFHDACHRICRGEGGMPVAYLHPGAYPMQFEPLIQPATEETIERAIRMFIQNGLKRIAVLAALDVRGHVTLPRVRRYYEWTMDEFGQDYRALVVTRMEREAILAAMKQLLDRPDPPQAIYVTDDHLVAAVLEVFKERRMVLGRDIAMICMTNKGGKLVQDESMSQYMFDPQQMGRLAVDSLLQVIQSAGEQLLSCTIHSQWHQGYTHQLYGRGVP